MQVYEPDSFNFGGQCDESRREWEELHVRHPSLSEVLQLHEDRADWRT